MFKSTIIFSVVINFLLFLLFADVLNAIRVTDPKTHLIIIIGTISGITILIYFLLMHARVSNLEQQVKHHISDQIEW